MITKFFINLFKAKAAKTGDIRNWKKGPHQKQADGKWKPVKRDRSLVRQTSKDPVIDKEKSQKSLKSPYYYQVPSKEGWKKYKTMGAYRKDFPKGPEKGHEIVNQNHPAHLRIKSDTFYIKVKKNGKIETFKSSKDFVKKYPIPSGKEAKETRFQYNIIADFRHKDWHPSIEEKLNANSRFHLGIQRQYQKYRENIKKIHEKEAISRKIVRDKSYITAGKITSEKGKPRRIIRKQPDIIRKGTKVNIEYLGKKYEGKVLSTKSVGRKGELVQKAATHFEVEFTKKGHPTDLRKFEKDTKWIPAEKVERKSLARKGKSKKEQELIREEKDKKKLSQKIKGAIEKLNVRNDFEYQAKVANMLGDLKDKNNQYRRIVVDKAHKIISDMEQKGMNPYSAMTHENIIMSGLSGIFEALLTWNPEKGKLSTYLQSDKVKDHISKAINESLAIERQQFHKMSPDLKLAIMRIKSIDEDLTASLGKRPRMDEMKAEYERIFGPIKKFDFNKLVSTSRNKRVSNMVKDINQSGEIDIISSAISPIKGPEKTYLEKEKMAEFHKILGKLVTPVQAQALLLRFRVDETTTGKGVFGEESPYYTQEAPDISKFEGLKDVSKREDLRNYDEISNIFAKNGIKITKNEIKKQIQEAQDKIRNDYESGNPEAKRFLEVGLNKSYSEKRKFLENHLLKSLFPEKRNTWKETLVKRMNNLVKSVYIKTAA